MNSTSWPPWIADVWQRTEDRFDELKSSLAACLTGRDRIKICCYNSFGDLESVRLLGRVIEDPGDLASGDDSKWWHNIIATVKRFESDEIVGAEVRLRYGSSVITARTDREGYFDCTLSLPADFEVISEWTAELVSAPGYDTRYIESLEPAHGLMTIVDPQVQFGTISDVDDTVMPSHATQWWRMVWKVLVENASSRLPFPGVAEFYRALMQGGDGKRVNPIFYVSSSPWNLYDLLVEVFQRHHLPAGPLLLKDIGLGPDSRGVGNHGGKLQWINAILERFPTLPFVLIGDSGQKDAWIYQEAIHRNPDRVRAVYIRNVPGTDLDPISQIGNELASRGVPLLILDKTDLAFQHAAEQGWIQSSQT